MTAFEKAIVQQQVIHKLVDKKLLPQRYNWRLFSLHPDFSFKEVLEHGIGYFPVNKNTGEPCDCTMEWDEEGTVLLCTKCLIDGT